MYKYLFFAIGGTLTDSQEVIAVSGKEKRTKRFIVTER